MHEQIVRVLRVERRSKILVTAFSGGTNALVAFYRSSLVTIRISATEDERYRFLRFVTGSCKFAISISVPVQNIVSKRPGYFLSLYLLLLDREFRHF